jgi:hypothetical protein
MWTEEEYEEVLAGVSQLGWLVLKRFSTSYRPSEVLAVFHRCRTKSSIYSGGCTSG